MAVEQLVGHVALVIEIADVGGRQPQQFGARADGQQSLQRRGPLLGPGAVVFVQDDVGRLLRSDVGAVGVGQAQQLGVGVEVDVGKRNFGSLAVQALALGLEDVVAGGQPEDGGLGVVGHELEGDVTFAGAGGVDDRCLADGRQQSDCGVIGCTIMRKQIQHRRSPPLLQQNQRFVVAGTAHNANAPAPVQYRGVFCVDLILMKIRQTDQQEAVALPVLFKLPIYRGFTLIGLNSHFYCAIIGIYLSSCANPYRMTC